MAQSIGSAWRSFWHTMTSNDRHASHDSPNRTGQHHSLPSSRQSNLTSVTSNANDSQTDFLPSATLTGFSNAAQTAGSVPQSPSTPYSPGMRSAMQRAQSDERVTSPAKTPGEIPMQNFSDGLPPPPPISHSWNRIDRWAEDNYEELYDNLSEGCTQNDINELEHGLDCTLPLEVRESLQVHDGQERGGLPTGIIFGCMLLDCEEIVQEWKNWQTVNDEYLNREVTVVHQVPSKTFSSAPSSSSQAHPSAAPPPWRDQLLARQDSQPAGAIQKAYTHPAWIPLARDWGGNNIAVDLAPGPSGKWGQVILMGRDYDCKYVIARSWGVFLATLADDLHSNKVVVSEESGELRLRQFKDADPGYLDILRWRCDQKYGRKPRPRPNPDLSINPNMPIPGRRQSPYGSPVASESDRGRSPQRFPHKQAHKLGSASPRSHISSPLARVTEERGPAMRTSVDSTSTATPKPAKLLPVATPVAEMPPSPPETIESLPDTQIDDKNKENQPILHDNVRNKENQPIPVGAGPNGRQEAVKSTALEEDGEMKTVDI